MPMYWDGGGGLASSMPVHDIPPPSWYRSQVETEPGYVAWKTGADTARTDAGTRRRAAIQALALQYGGIPTGYTDEYGDFDPTELALDAANPQSQLNRLKASYETQQQQLSTSLAARGALHSGDYVYGQDQLANQYATNLGDAATAFLGGIGQGGMAGAADDYLQAYNAAYADQGTQINDAINRLEQLYPTTGTDTTATLDPDWSTKYSTPVYTTPDGNLYQIGPDGNLEPYTPPPADTGGGGGTDTSGGGSTTTPPTQDVQYPSGTYTLNGVTYNASTGLPINANPPGAAGPSNISLLPYYYGGGPLGRPQGPGSVVYY